MILLRYPLIIEYDCIIREFIGMHLDPKEAKEKSDLILRTLKTML
jgi:hypothetical protein